VTSFFVVLVHFILTVSLCVILNAQGVVICWSDYILLRGVEVRLCFINNFMWNRGCLKNYFSLYYHVGNPCFISEDDMAFSLS